MTNPAYYLSKFMIIQQLMIIVLGICITFLLTDFLIKSLVIKQKVKNPKILATGLLIGRCENIIIISFILANEITGLALIFAAKNLVRRKDINKNPGYFLAGTMLNFTASLIMGYVIKYVLKIF